MKSKDRKALKKFSQFKEITNKQGIFQEKKKLKGKHMRLPKAFRQNEIAMTELQILQGVTKIFKMF